MCRLFFHCNTDGIVNGFSETVFDFISFAHIRLRHSYRSQIWIDPIMSLIRFDLRLFVLLARVGDQLQVFASFQALYQYKVPFSCDLEFSVLCKNFLKYSHITFSTAFDAPKKPRM